MAQRQQKHSTDKKTVATKSLSRSKTVKHCSSVPRLRFRSPIQETTKDRMHMLLSSIKHCDQWKKKKKEKRIVTRLRNIPGTRSWSATRAWTRTFVAAEKFIMGGYVYLSEFSRTCWLLYSINCSHDKCSCSSPYLSLQSMYAFVNANIMHAAVEVHSSLSILKRGKNKPIKTPAKSATA